MPETWRNAAVRRLSATESVAAGARAGEKPLKQDRALRSGDAPQPQSAERMLARGCVLVWCQCVVATRESVEHDAAPRSVVETTSLRSEGGMQGWWWDAIDWHVDARRPLRSRLLSPLSDRL